MADRAKTWKLNEMELLSKRHKKDGAERLKKIQPFIKPNFKVYIDEHETRNIQWREYMLTFDVYA